jgi:hypothetical protein
MIRLLINVNQDHHGFAWCFDTIGEMMGLLCTLGLVFLAIP